ncbi:MAG: acetyl-CoA carboxylase carboxyl transferase subunit beta [Lachnospiraceae bacterium]|nr:acetyl-CoA carboxylase carboxyl transferase subunit beta [Lachnospiraceae bacterium]
MNLRDLFKKAENELEDSGGIRPEESNLFECPSCHEYPERSAIRENDSVCPICGHHFRMGARRHILMLSDGDGFEEYYADTESTNLLDFPGYEEKLKTAMEASGEKEGVVCGKTLIGGYPVMIFAMDPNFMMGSMGTVVGEKITRLFEDAVKEGLPVLGITVSGGARMQEGILSLMQMAKVSGAVKRHSEAGLLYITLLTNPTTGGVEASFAMQGDILIAEPDALIGFAGPRVIEQTLKEKLPKGFQRSEAVLSTGFLDGIVPRKTQREYLTRVLKIHQRPEEN